MIFRKFDNIFGKFSIRSLHTYNGEGATLFKALVTRHAYLSYQECISHSPFKNLDEKREIEELWVKFVKTSNFSTDIWNFAKESKRECDQMVSDYYFETERANQDGFMGRSVRR